MLDPSIPTTCPRRRTAIAARDAAACFTWVSEYVETGADLARFAVASRRIRARSVYSRLDRWRRPALDAPQAACPAMAKEAASFGPDRLAYILRVLGDLSAELRSSVNPRLSFEIALTRMVRPESDLTLDALAARVATLEAALASGLVAASVPAPAAASSASTPGRVGFAAGRGLPLYGSGRPCRLWRAGIVRCPLQLPRLRHRRRLPPLALPRPPIGLRGFRAEVEQRRAAKTAAPVESAPSAAPFPPRRPCLRRIRPRLLPGSEQPVLCLDDIRAKTVRPVRVAAWVAGGDCGFETSACGVRRVDDFGAHRRARRGRGLVHTVLPSEQLCIFGCAEA